MFSSLSKNTPKLYVNLVIMFGIMLLFRWLTPPEGLTAEGMAVIGIFLGSLYGWLAIDLVWPSLIGLIVLGLSTSVPMTKVLGSAFGNTTVLLLTFFCMVASIINSAGIGEYTARKIISVKFVRGRPYVLIFMLSVATIALATMLTMTAAVLIAFPLVKEVCRLYGYKPGDKLPMLLLIAMLYVADIAYMMLPFKSIPALVFGIYNELSHGGVINYAAYVAVVGIMTLVGITFMIVYFKFILRPDVSLIQNSSLEMTFTDSLNSYQKLVLWSFVSLIVLLLVPNVAPADWMLVVFLKKLTTNGLLLAYIGFYLLLNFKQGISFKEIMTHSMAWPAIYLVISVLSITGAFDNSGITTWLGSVFQPILAGYSGTFLVFIIIVIGHATTQLTNNTACAATLTPIAYTLAVANGNVDPQAILTCVILSCTLGLATPAAGTTAAIMYGDTDWVHRGTVVRHASVFWIVNVFLTLFIAYNLCIVMF